MLPPSAFLYIENNEFLESNIQRLSEICPDELSDFVVSSSLLPRVADGLDPDQLLLFPED